MDLLSSLEVELLLASIFAVFLVGFGFVQLYLLNRQSQRVQQLPSHALMTTGDAIARYISKTTEKLRVETIDSQDSYTFTDEEIPVLVLSNKTIHSYSMYSLAHSFYLIALIKAYKVVFRRFCIQLIDLAILFGGFTGTVVLITSIGLDDLVLFRTGLLIFYAAVGGLIVSTVNQFLITESALKQLQIVDIIEKDSRDEYSSYFNLLALNQVYLIAKGWVMILNFLVPWRLVVKN